MKTARFNRLLATTALGVALVLGSHAGMAQQSQQQIDLAVPMPDTELPPPLTAKDVAATPGAIKAETKQDAATPAVEPAKAAAEPAKAIAEPKPVAQPEKAAAAPVAAPVSATADSAVADQLRDMIAGKLDRIVTRKPDREGVEAFYKARDYKPLWVSDGAADARAKAAIAFLAQVDTDGLDPADYPAPDFKTATTASELAEDEVKLTASVLTYARQAQTGRIHFSRVGADIDFKLVAPEPAEVLAKLAGASDVAAALDGYNPPQAEFKALKQKLAELRQGVQAPKADEEKKPDLVRIGDGKTLHVGMKDPRVVQLRKRLDVPGDKTSQLYDEAVRDAVKTFQTEADIDVDGNLGPNTLRALNGEKKVARGPSADPIDTVIVNMERWRWFPRDLGNPHVIVNVPDYTLTLYNDDKPYWKSKIVAGKPGKATPMVSAEMKFITVNPTWNVPPSIIENEYLPALQQDPDALDRIGLKLTQDADGTIHISQPPGAGNALGRIRFNFPNKFLVYQHDTPDKYLFAREERAYSHGCMRVQNPLIYGEKLLSLVDPQGHYTAAKLESMFGGSEININFPKNIWVHLTYQTAFVDEDGKLQFRKDVYGRDARMIAILKGSERKVADIAIERKPDASSKPVRAPVGMYGGNGGYSSGGFFDFLFGGPHAAPQPTYRPPRPVGQRYGNNGRYFFR
ncbi:MAG TPA: L,D-transpeptidase family protein [Pseudolabrys sp.]|nr:L,D-transpeptidase family protein [Pseudolabrys sp.]